MNKRKFKKLLYLLVMVVISAFLIFNEDGIRRYLRMRSEINELNKSIEKTDAELDSLRGEIDSLKTSLYKIEKVAREKYHMLGKNEHAIKVEKKQNN